MNAPSPLLEAFRIDQRKRVEEGVVGEVRDWFLANVGQDLGIGRLLRARRRLQGAKLAVGRGDFLSHVGPDRLGESLEPLINVRPEPRVRVGIEQIEGADRKDEQAGHSQEQHIEQADPLAVADQGQFQKRPADDGHQQNAGNDEHGGKGDREPPLGKRARGNQTAHEQAGTCLPDAALPGAGLSRLSPLRRRGRLGLHAGNRLVSAGASWAASARRTRTRPQHHCMNSL